MICLKQTRVMKINSLFLCRRYTYPGFAITLTDSITGTEHFKNLPKRNVLFVSNHQTYFADVSCSSYFLCSKMEKRKQTWYSLLFIESFYPRVLGCGCWNNEKQLHKQNIQVGRGYTVKRTWRSAGKKWDARLIPGTPGKIARALENNWVITFPARHNEPFAPGRKGYSIYYIKKL